MKHIQDILQWILIVKMDAIASNWNERCCIILYLQFFRVLIFKILTPSLRVPNLYLFGVLRFLSEMVRWRWQFDCSILLCKLGYFKDYLFSSLLFFGILRLLGSKRTWSLTCSNTDWCSLWLEIQIFKISAEIWIKNTILRIFAFCIFAITE